MLTTDNIKISGRTATTMSASKARVSLVLALIAQTSSLSQHFSCYFSVGGFCTTDDEICIPK
ncbi:hypothetical protein ACS0TY_032453 [Phlomoides rotata]